MKFLVRKKYLAVPVSLLLSSVTFPISAEPAAHPGIPLYQQMMAKQPVAGQCFEVDIAQAPTVLRHTNPDRQVVQASYPMTHNNIAEGWSWHPEAARSNEDYYRFKYLPVGTEIEERGEYPNEDKIGVTESVKIRWQHDYFLAFENIYDFFPRNPDDDEAGFVAELGAIPENTPIKLTANFCMQAPMIRESTTFWKATYGKPVDFTLKKHYLIGTLQAVTFTDGITGRPLAHLKPLASASAP